VGFDDFLDDLGAKVKWGAEHFSAPGIIYNSWFKNDQGKFTVNSPVEAYGRATTPGANPVQEQALSKVRWVYNNAISQPLATTMLVGKQPWSKQFDADTWSKSWHAANHISPGQAIFLMSPQEADEAVNSPLTYMRPPDAYLPPGFKDLAPDEQQRILKDAGMPAVGNAYIEKKRGSGWYSFGSGSVDFATVMFADPLVIAGRGISAARTNASTFTRPKGGWSEQNIDEVLAQSRITKLMEGVWANRSNPQLINNTVLAQRSGMGPRFGSIASRLQDPEELHLFIRTGMGDARAMRELRLRNADIDARMENINSRVAALDLMRSNWAHNPGASAMIDAEMGRLGKQYSNDALAAQRYNDILDNAYLLDQLHASRWTRSARKFNESPDISRARGKTREQNVYTTGAARTTDPMTGAVQTSRLWGAGDYFTRGPLHLVRMLQNVHPNGYMNIDRIDDESIRELRSHLARIPGIKETTRNGIVNDYLKTTTETQRKDLLEEVGRMGAAKIAVRHGLTPEEGEAIWAKQETLKLGEIDNMRKYSAGRRSPEEVATMREQAGLPQVPYGTDPLGYIDTFLDVSGAVKVSPFTATRLMNGHTFQDLDALNKVLSRGGAEHIKTLRETVGSARDTVEAASDRLTYLWKFTTLFRAGYIPRTLGDDIASQWAALGSAALAVRIGRGVKNMVSNASMRMIRPALAARESMATFGADYAANEMKLLKPQIRDLEQKLAVHEAGLDTELRQAFRRHQAAQGKLTAEMAQPTPSTTQGAQKRAALQTFARQREQQLRQAEMRLAAGAPAGKKIALKNLKDQHDYLQRSHDFQRQAAADLAEQQKRVVQGTQSVKLDDRVIAPAAFEGKEGQYLMKLSSADDSIGYLLNTNKQIMQGNAARSFDHGAKPVSAAQDAPAHLSAWAHAINNVIMQDPLSKMAVKGATVEEMTNWLTKTPMGIAYRKRLPKMIQTEDFAQSAKFEVDQYMHSPELRMKALEGEVSEAWLAKAFPKVVDRPDVHIGQVGLTQLHHMNTVDRMVQGFYKVFASMPATRMSRHPLFNQLYEGHLKKITRQSGRQGAPARGMDVEDLEAAAHAARQLALRDMRKLVFDISHRSDAAAAMRFVSPFFSATAESFQRWGRVIADRPQVAGYMGTWYNAPLYSGNVQDTQGNDVDQYGYSYVPIYPLGPDGNIDYSQKPTIEKRMVPKAERYIVTRVPKWVADSPVGVFMNIRQADGKFMASQNSINMITQGDPFFNPGVGPVVQVPVNEFVRDKPRLSELARNVGILPYGAQGAGEGPVRRIFDVVAPAQIKNLLTAYDTSDTRYQQVKMQITQQEIFKFQERHEGRPPTKAEQAAMAQSIADKTKHYWQFSALSSFVQPFATQRKDPYQFYRDQYLALRRQNPITADDEYLTRYGESHFVFAQEITNSMGVPPTKRAVELQQKYAKEIATNPELAALIIGPEGNGPFSPDSYTYQLNNPLVPGSPEMMRSKMTADEAMLENQRRLGWAKYTAVMNGLRGNLHASGFNSFSDKGAEQFALQKKAYTAIYAEPLLPNGEVNPTYNEEWSKDFFTQDQRKYERLIPGLTQVAYSDQANNPIRTDLRSLQMYLGARKAIMQQMATLQAGGLPHTLTAGANATLRRAWVGFVDGLIESDTRFGDLYHRYLSRDLGVDAEEEAQTSEG
jgi:hypothetical protein